MARLERKTILLTFNMSYMSWLLLAVAANNYSVLALFVLTLVCVEHARRDIKPGQIRV